MMRVLITGATGFIGSQLTRVLLNEGYPVYALIRSTSNTWRIEDLLKSLHVVRGDLLEPHRWSPQLEKIQPEICFHLAWYVEPGKYLTSQENLGLLTSSIQLASQLSKLGCKKIITTGTCFEYDTDRGYLSETTPLKPRSLYAACKSALYKVLLEFLRTAEMDFAWLRLFYQYGPYEDQRRLIPYIICSLLRNKEAKLTKGEQIRDYLHVEDVATAILAVAQSNLSGPINVGSGRPISVRDLSIKIGEILNKPELIKLGAIPYEDSESMFICANINRLKNNTNFVPQYNIEEGLQNTINWWERQLKVKKR